MENKWKNFDFDLFGTVWHVVFTKDTIKDKYREEESDGFFFGITYPDERTINIALLNRNNEPLLDNEIFNTLTHEVVHAILDTGMYTESSGDEPLVEWVAKCIISLLKQKVFKYEE